MQTEEDLKDLIIDGMADAMLQLSKGILLMGIGTDERITRVFHILCERVGEEEAFEQMLEAVQENTIAFLDANKESFSDEYAESVLKLIQNQQK